MNIKRHFTWIFI